MNYFPVTLNEKRKFLSEILKILTDDSRFVQFTKKPIKRNSILV